MWRTDDVPSLSTADPAEQLWLIALLMESNGAPRIYVQALRRLAERPEDLTWWLTDSGAAGLESGAAERPPHASTAQ